MRHLALALGLAASPLAAQEAPSEVDLFVESNLYAILYHELGHAFIDILEMPVFGQEEDAADVASILLINDLFDEETATAITYDTAFAFLGEAEEREAAGEAPAWWGVHGIDLQRYYTLVCLFVGADPGARDHIAEDLGLPAERQETCEEEFWLANESWGAVFDEMAAAAPGESFVYLGGTDSLTEQVVAAEVAALNEDFALPEDLVIRVEACDEANAFYDPVTVEVVMCSEFEDWLREIAPR
jgi:hypothetical protein